MKAARARFKYALRANKRAEETAKADHWQMNYVKKIMIFFGRMFQRLINHLMLLLIVSMVYQENQILHIFGSIILVLF